MDPMGDSRKLVKTIPHELHENIPISPITAWWYTYPSEKYESQMGLLFPNHQPGQL